MRGFLFFFSLKTNDRCCFKSMMNKSSKSKKRIGISINSQCNSSPVENNNDGSFFYPQNEKNNTNFLPAYFPDNSKNSHPKLVINTNVSGIQSSQNLFQFPENSSKNTQNSSFYTPQFAGNLNNQIPKFGDTSNFNRNNNSKTSPIRMNFHESASSDEEFSDSENDGSEFYQRKSKTDTDFDRSDKFIRIRNKNSFNHQDAFSNGSTKFSFSNAENHATDFSLSSNRMLGEFCSDEDDPHYFSDNTSNRSDNYLRNKKIRLQKQPVSLSIQKGGNHQEEFYSHFMNTNFEDNPRIQVLSDCTGCTAEKAYQALIDSNGNPNDAAMMLLNENQNFQDTTNKSSTPNFDHNNSNLQNNPWMNSTGSIKISKHQPVHSPIQDTTSQAISFSKRRIHISTPKPIEERKSSPYQFQVPKIIHLKPSVINKFNQTHFSSNGRNFQEGNNEGNYDSTSYMNDPLEEGMKSQSNLSMSSIHNSSNDFFGFDSPIIHLDINSNKRSGILSSNSPKDHVSIYFNTNVNEESDNFLNEEENSSDNKKSENSGVFPEQEINLFSDNIFYPKVQSFDDDFHFSSHSSLSIGKANNSDSNLALDEQETDQSPEVHTSLHGSKETTDNESPFSSEGVNITELPPPIFCPSCHSQMNEENFPSILSCGHSMCKKCTEDLKKCQICQKSFDFFIKNYQAIEMIDCLMKKSEGNLEGGLCIICCEKFDDNKHQAMTFTCGHTFCSSCVSFFRKDQMKICPRCRQNIDINIGIPNYLVVQLAEYIDE